MLTQVCDITCSTWSSPSTSIWNKSPFKVFICIFCVNRYSSRKVKALFDTLPGLSIGVMMILLTMLLLTTADVRPYSWWFEYNELNCPSCWCPLAWLISSFLKTLTWTNNYSHARCDGNAVNIEQIEWWGVKEFSCCCCEKIWAKFTRFLWCTTSSFYLESFEIRSCVSGISIAVHSIT